MQKFNKNKKVRIVSAILLNVEGSKIANFCWENFDSPEPDRTEPVSHSGLHQTDSGPDLVTDQQTQGQTSPRPDQMTQGRTNE